MNRTLAVLCAGAMLLAGCNTTAALKTVCAPSLKTYTAAEQKALATELEAMADMDPIALALADYARMRDAVRACQAAKP